MSEALQIGRLALTVQGATDDSLPRVQAWCAQWRGLDAETLAGRWVDSESWLLIRRLPMALRWHAGLADAEAGPAFAQALSQAIDEALARGDADVLRYPNRRAALADLMMRAAQRDTSRQWAWHRMGLLPREDLGSVQVLAHGLATLVDEPALAWPVLRRLLAGETRCAALSALLRALSPADWRQWLSQAPQAAPWSGFVGRAMPRVGAAADRPPPAIGEPAAARELRQWAARRPMLRERHGALLAALLAALRHDGLRLSAAQAQDAWRAAALDLAPAGPVTATVPAPSRPRIAQPAVLADPQAAAQPAAPLPPPADTAAAPSLPDPGPDLPEPGPRRPTRHGGALFWLTRAVSAGLAQPAAAARLPVWLLALGRALGLPDDDPALAAFCGGESPTEEPDEALAALAADQAQVWAQWLDVVAPDLPAPRLDSVCRRSGWLSIEPGWIELHLPLDSVDLAIRRLGLDLDPGWIAPLACVLRIRYDD